MLIFFTGRLGAAFFAPRRQIWISLVNLQWVWAFYRSCQINSFHSGLLWLLCCRGADSGGNRMRGICDFRSLCDDNFNCQGNVQSGSLFVWCVRTDFQYDPSRSILALCWQIRIGEIRALVPWFWQLLQIDQWKRPLDSATNTESGRWTLESYWNGLHAMGKTIGRLCNGGIKAT